MDDMFGDSTLFDEFEKERESTGSFITYDKTNEGKEDKSKIVFTGDGDSDTSDSSSDEESNEESESKNDAGCEKTQTLATGLQNSSHFQLEHERILKLYVYILTCF